MKEVSKKILNHILGDSQINIFKLQGEEDYVIVIQDKLSKPLAVVGKDSNGEFITIPESLPIIGESRIISSIGENELVELAKKLSELIEIISTK